MEKNGHPFRSLTILEQQIMDRLLEKDFPGRDAICEQMKNCVVKTIDENGSLEFLTQTNVKAKVNRRIPIEAEFQDPDGVAVHILLHVVDEKINELEIYKEDGSPLGETPDPSKLQVVCFD